MMKKIYLFSFFITLVCFSASQVPIISSGGVRDRAFIVVGENASDSELFAAVQLRECIYNLTGVKLLIKRENDRTSQAYKKIISIGRTSRIPEQIRNKLNEQNVFYIVDISNSGIFLAGKTEEGTLCAVFTVLKKLGFRFDKDGVICPEKKTSLAFEEEHTTGKTDAILDEQFKYRAYEKSTKRTERKISDRLFEYLVRNKKPSSVIVVGRFAVDREVYAAETLKSYIKQMTGVELSIFRDDQEIPENLLIVSVGRTNFLTDEIKQQIFLDKHISEIEPENDAFIIRKEASVLYLVGHRDEGTVFAVFDFLEQLGCRWFFGCDAGIVIPSGINEIKISQQNIFKKPCFGFRWFYSWFSRDQQTIESEQLWANANKLDEAPYNGYSGHNLGSVVPVELYDNHPEYFPLIKGQRVKKQPGAQNWQPCFSNPDVIKVASEWVFRQIENNPGLKVITLAPNDGDGYCECENCKNLGTKADAYFYFVNEVAKIVHKKYPEVIFCIWAYYQTSLPTKINFYDRDRFLLIMYQNYTLTPFDKLVDWWSDKVNRIEIKEIWEWSNWRLGPNQDPHYRKGKILKIPIYAKKNAIAISLQARADWVNNGLDRYIAAKLMWDISLSIEDIIKDFVLKMFPSATLEFYAYLDLYDTRGKGEITQEKFLKDALFLFRRIKEKIKTPEEEKRWKFYVMYLHQQVLEYEIEKTQDPARKLELYKEMVSFLKGTKKIMIAESDQLIKDVCFDFMVSLGYEGKDKNFPELKPTEIDDGQIIKWFNDDCEKYPRSISTVIQKNR